MARINENFLALKQSYLFSDIAKRVNAFVEKNPDKKLIRMGIGDVTIPLAPAVVKAMKDATDEMSTPSGFRGYGPEQGYDFLREAVVNYYQKRSKVTLDMGEVFISDGAKSDVGNITDLFDKANTVLIPDPVYPAYIDTNTMNGRNIVLLPSTMDNGFAPLPDDSIKADLIYLCSPNNPTGSVYTAQQLKLWVDYAKKNGAVILFDAAYEAFVSDDSLPRSIFQIEGARECAVEFCSLSKTAGFTGTRCGYTVVPKELMGKTEKGEQVALNQLWLRRQTTKFNGVPYIVQKGAQAVFSDEGQKEIRENLDYYMGNAKVMAEALTKLNIPFVGGVNSPYIWLECPAGMDSWSFFDKLLNEAAVVGTPGQGFGNCGEGYFRLSAFNTRENTVEAMERLAKMW